MIKKVEKNQVVVKVLAYKGERSNTQLATYIVDNEGYYILDIIEHVRKQSFIPTQIYVYESNKTQADVFMIHENGAIQWLDDYYD
jgi:hypothetical protein